jgi:hypothetical protein
MLASSGLDGTYMARWMSVGWGWSGYILNTMADIAGMVITYQYGCLQRKRDDDKKVKSRRLLVAEWIAVGFSWFFSWRQLRMVMPAVEPDSWQWVSPISAAFIPLLLAYIGYAQSLHETATIKNEPATPLPIELDEWLKIAPKLNGDMPALTAGGINGWLDANGFETKAPSTAQYWARRTKEVVN